MLSMRIRRAVQTAGALLGGCVMIAATESSLAADGIAWSEPEDVALAQAPAVMRVDGRALRVKALVSELSPAQVERAWRERWSGAGAVAISDTASGWRVLSRRVGNELQTVQLRARAGGGTEGYAATGLAVTERRPAAADGAEGAPFRLPLNSRTLRVVETRDGADIGVQVVLHMGDAPNFALGRLVRAAQLAGWSEAGPFVGASAPMHASTRWLTREREELGLFVSRARDGGTLAVLHRVRSRSAHGAGR